MFTYFVLIEGQYTRTCIISKMCGLPYGHGMRQQQELLFYGLMVLSRSTFFSFVLFFVRLVRPKYITHIHTHSYSKHPFLVPIPSSIHLQFLCYHNINILPIYHFASLPPPWVFCLFFFREFPNSTDKVFVCEFCRFLICSLCVSKDMENDDFFFMLNNVLKFFLRFLFFCLFDGGE